MSKTIKIRRTETQVIQATYYAEVPNDWELGEEGEDELERLAARAALEGKYDEDVIDMTDATAFELVES